MLGSNTILNECLNDIQYIQEIEFIKKYIGYHVRRKGEIFNKLNDGHLSRIKEALSDTFEKLDNEIQKNALALTGNAFAYYFDYLDKTIDVNLNPLLDINKPKIYDYIEQHKSEIKINEQPVYITLDLKYECFQYIQDAITKFISIIKRHVDLFKSGKLMPNNNAAMRQETQSESAIAGKQKLKTNMSVEQLTYLFRLLHQLKPNLFNVESDAELYRFISQHFTTKRKSSDLSVDKIRILFGDSELEKKNVVFWEAQLAEMLEWARKDRKKFL